MDDTSPEVRTLQAEIFRRMTGVERLQIAFDLTEGVRELSRSRLRTQHPDWDEARLNLELLRYAFGDQPLPPPLRALLDRLPASEWFAQESVALAAIEHESVFNILNLADGWKFDLTARKSRSFSVHEFERRVPLQLQGRTISIATAEDVILSKLEWAKIGESERQLLDAAGILRVRGKELDFAYLEEWVSSLGIRAQWASACTVAGRNGSASGGWGTP